MHRRWYPPREAMANLKRRGDYTPRRTREQRAYRLLLAGGTTGGDRRRRARARDRRDHQRRLADHPADRRRALPRRASAPPSAASALSSPARRSAAAPPARAPRTRAPAPTRCRSGQPIPGAVPLNALSTASSAALNGNTKATASSTSLSAPRDRVGGHERDEGDRQREQESQQRGGADLAGEPADRHAERAEEPVPPVPARAPTARSAAPVEVTKIDTSSATSRASPRRAPAGEHDLLRRAAGPGRRGRARAGRRRAPSARARASPPPAAWSRTSGETITAIAAA